MFFPTSVLATVFSIPGPVTVGALEDKLGDIFGDAYRNAVSGIKSWRQVKFGNIKNAVSEVSVEDFILNKVDDCVNESETEPIPPDSLEIWADFQSETIESRNMTVDPDEMEFNSSAGYSWRMLIPGESQLTATFELDTIPDGVLLELTHLSSLAEGTPGDGYSPVDIIINGDMVEDNYDVAENHGNVHSYVTDVWQIEGFLREGSNTLRIEFEDDPWAYTHYWIQTIAVTFGHIDTITPPTVLVTKYSNEITAGDSVTIYVEARNESGLATDGGITISFPSFTGINDTQYVELIECSPDANYSEYSRGDSIWHRDIYQFPAKYLMVEIADNHIEQDESKYLKIRVKPQIIGGFAFYVRCAMGYDGVYYNDPEDFRAEVHDQQGWGAFWHRITVNPLYYDAVDVDQIKIEDDYGDGDGVPESGEALELKVYLKNKISQTITKVEGYLSPTTPNIIMKDNVVNYSEIDPEQVTYGNDDFDFRTLASFSGDVNLNLEVTFFKGSQKYYDVANVPVTIYPQGTDPYFSIESIAFYDTGGGHCDGDGVPESGEMGIDFTVELCNSGLAPGTHVTGIIDPLQINGHWVIDEQNEDYLDIPPEECRNPKGTFFIQGIPASFAGTFTADMHVVYGAYEADTQHLELPFEVEPTPYLQITPQSHDFGRVDPGDTVRTVFRVKNGGTANLIINAIDTDNSDTHIEDIVLPCAILPGNSDSFTVTIDTEGLNECITRNVTIFSNDHDTNEKNVVITGCAIPLPQDSCCLLWSTPKQSIDDPVCIQEGDTDNDGNPELIIGTQAYSPWPGTDTVHSRVHIYEKVADDTFRLVWTSPENAIDGGMSDTKGKMVTGDIDKDNALEIMLGTGKLTEDPKVYIFKSGGDNNWYLWYSGLGGNGNISRMAFGDADGDGKNEIIYGASGRVHVYENNGETSFTKVWTSPVLADAPGGIGIIKADDADSDGKNEIIVTTSDDFTTEDAELYIFETTGNDSWSEVFYTELDEGKAWETYDLAVYDFDRDGAKEIAVCCWKAKQVWIYENIGNDAYVLRHSANVVTHPLCIVGGDTDLDGYGEFIVGCDYNRLMIFEAFANNSYIQICGDFTSLDDVFDVCLTNTNSTPELEIALIDKDDRIVVYGICQETGQPNLTVVSHDIQFSNLNPVEGLPDTISIRVRNNGAGQASQVVVRVFDGNPNFGGTQIGNDININSLDAYSSSPVETEWIPTLAGTHYIYVLVDPDSAIIESDETDNMAFTEIYVFDDDENPPEITSIAINEHNGDGDGLMEDDEFLKVSWTLEDPSGIGTTSCKVDTLELTVSGSYYAIGGPFACGEHQLIITAMDADNTPEESADTTYFSVYYHAPSVDSVFPLEGDTVPVDVYITATFNEDMDDSSINESTFLLQDSAENLVSGLVGYIANTRTAQFIPDSFLKYDMAYTAILAGGSSKGTKRCKEKISNDYEKLFTHKQRHIQLRKGGIRDAHGNYLDSNYVWTFKTESAPVPVYEMHMPLIPQTYALMHNYPNPFVSITTIRFALPKESQVSLKMYDMTGRLVETLLNEKLEAGYHTVNWNSKGIPSGVYFYKIQADNYTQTRKMILVK